MTVTYIIHKYAGTTEDRTLRVTGEAAKLALSFQNEQEKVGITILEVDDGGTS